MGDFVVLLVKLIGIGACGWILMYFIHERVQPVSRRMVNASYCIWVVSNLYSSNNAIYLDIYCVFPETIKILLHGQFVWPFCSPICEYIKVLITFIFYINFLIH